MRGDSVTSSTRDFPFAPLKPLQLSHPRNLLSRRYAWNSQRFTKEPPSSERLAHPSAPLSRPYRGKGRLAVGTPSPRPASKASGGTDGCPLGGVNHASTRPSQSTRAPKNVGLCFQDLGAFPRLRQVLPNVSSLVVGPSFLSHDNSHPSDLRSARGMLTNFD